MWKAVLNNGKVWIPKDGTWLDINEPIKSIEVLGVEINKADEYYLVFHAMAFPGKQGNIMAIEFGGKFGNIYRGFIVDRLGMKPKNYKVKEFPYVNSLKPGSGG